MTAPAAIPRWFYPTRVRFAVGLLVVEELLWSAEQFQWFAFNTHKGFGVLIEVAVIGAGLILMLLGSIASRLFHLQWPYSMSTVLILALAAALPISCLSVARKNAARQRDALAEFDKPGCFVEYDYQRDALGNAIPDAQPLVPIWLRNLLGDDFFTNVVSLKFTGPEATDDALNRIGDLNRLQSLDLDGSQVTGDGLRYLKGLDRLRALDLSGTRVTDDAMASLKRLPKLAGLNLSETLVTDAGLSQLEGLKRLQSLQVCGAKVTEAGVKRLQQALPACEIVR